MEHKPDIVCLAKGLTGGFLPLGVTACSDRIHEAFRSDDLSKTFFHGHSFTGNPLGCAVALASLDLTEDPDCWSRIAWLQQRFEEFCQSVRGRRGGLEVRTLGTVLAATLGDADQGYLAASRDQLYAFFLERGVLMRPLGNTLYMLPPYVITEDQVEKALECLEQAIEAFL